MPSEHKLGAAQNSDLEGKNKCQLRSHCNHHVTASGKEAKEVGLRTVTWKQGLKWAVNSGQLTLPLSSKSWHFSRQSGLVANCISAFSASDRRVASDVSYSCLHSTSSCVIYNTRTLHTRYAALPEKSLMERMSVPKVQRGQAFLPFCLWILDLAKITSTWKTKKCHRSFHLRFNNLKLILQVFLFSSTSPHFQYLITLRCDSELLHLYWANFEICLPSYWAFSQISTETKAKYWMLLYEILKNCLGH